jgi:hypothetical protein
MEEGIIGLNLVLTHGRESVTEIADATLHLHLLEKGLRGVFAPPHAVHRPDSE